MARPYEVIGFVGHGCYGAVFHARYQGRDTALKAHFFPGKKSKNAGMRMAQQDFGNLERIEGDRWKRQLEEAIGALS